MHIDLLILIASATVLLTTAVVTIKETALAQFLASRKKHVVEFEFEGESVKIDPMAPPPTNKTAIDKATELLHKSYEKSH